ncbi:MAG: BREX system P-loop protein BrxC, partial [Desulfobia sp.]
MQIKEIFKKDISRPINGVVKADQLDEAVIWQELDEYVITDELNRHLRKFLSAYLAGVDNPGDPVIASRMGVWISGFFGSGKSHFIKILSYLLANRKTIHPRTGEEKEAISFFKNKMSDPLMLGDLQRTADFDTTVILFNIDSRADVSDDTTSLLSVFWRVFNENLGYCSQSLHLAELERYLDKKGKYGAFKDKFREIYGSPWEDERDAYSLLQDEITEALASVLGKSQEAAGQWFERTEQDLIVSIENFAKRVKEYLDSSSRNHRVVFLVDEIGQFIGNNSRLMLNLQTLVEDIGRLCNGRAWILVTSQEDIDTVIGDIKSAKANDFSKIQGRFHTRLSLSSANTDEVIQARLLEKDEAAVPELRQLYDQKGDILKNQLSFTADSGTLKNYSDPQDFVENYPFIPYHFQLVQKIFESIRKAGATGLHLSRGERSMLDAFQSAATNLGSRDVGVLVPLYEFYPCIESFLDTAVKRSIEQAGDNEELKAPFDILILQTLFLIRYIDIIKPNLENLVTLCIKEADTDRIELKSRIEKALGRLEKQYLINRNGYLYFFLTNEEQEVSREIEKIETSASAETQLLGDIIFDDILKNKTKHKYAAYNRDYPLNRICDGKYWGNPLDNELGVEIISPLHEEYDQFSPGKCTLYSSNNDANLIIKMGENSSMVRELRLYLQVNKYIRDK